MPKCEYSFEKWVGRKIGQTYQGERLGGAVFKTSCGSEVYGMELATGRCIYCGRDVEVIEKPISGAVGK